MTLLHRYEDYRWLRGFNLVPSWGARIEQAWWEFDRDQFRAEVSLARSVHANCIRLWIEFTAWMAKPDRVQRHFMDAIDAIDEQGMKVMPCLFNRWHDARYDYGGTYFEDFLRDFSPRADYLRAIVSPLVGDDRVLLWDLCNEPGGGRPDEPMVAEEFAWLQRVRDVLRSLNVQQPITIGTHQHQQNMAIFAPLSDVLCCHPYGKTPAELAEMLQKCLAVREQFGKPMLSNETIPGCLDDRKRADCARWTIQMMEDAGLGWMGWSMKEGLAVSTRRDRFDGNGIDGQGFHAWFNRDGSLRDGLEFLTQPPRFVAPWALQSSSHQTPSSRS